MSKKPNTQPLRVSRKTLELADEAQRIIAVETEGKVLNKYEAMEIVFQEFLDRRKKK